MAGYLDEYGVAEAKRERTIKTVIVSALIAVVVATSLFLWLRNRSEEGVVDRFLATLRDKNYQGAYALWGCTPQTPCPYYSPDRFIEDWGASGTYKNASEMKVEHVDSCDTGVVFDLSYPGTDDQGLWVERKTKVISFAPWSRCPGPHWQIGEFFKSHFGGAK